MHRTLDAPIPVDIPSTARTARVAVVRTRPERVLDDYARVMDLAGYRDTIARDRDEVPVLPLWVLAAATTAVLNLDTTIVLLTPLYVRLARNAHLPATGHDRDPAELVLGVAVIPLLLAQFRRCARAQWVFAGFAASSAVLLILSWGLALVPGLPWRGKVSVGVPVKDYIMQSAIFTACAFGLIGQAAAR